MTLPPVIRIFFAVDLPPAIKESLGSFIVNLKRHAKSNGIRWSRPDNLHITLQFMAEVRSEHVSLLINEVRKTLAAAPGTLHFSIGKLQLFPSPYRPRVIVLEINPQEQLADLAEKVGQGILAASYEIERRPFRAHLTLGRLKHAQHAHLEFLPEVAMPDIGDIAVEEIVLFRSEPQPEGSKYTPLERISLL